MQESILEHTIYPNEYQNLWGMAMKLLANWLFLRNRENENCTTLIVGGCHPKSTASTWRMMGTENSRWQRVENSLRKNDSKENKL